MAWTPPDAPPARPSFRPGRALPVSAVSVPIVALDGVGESGDKAPMHAMRDLGWGLRPAVCEMAGGMVVSRAVAASMRVAHCRGGRRGENRKSPGPRTGRGGGSFRRGWTKDLQTVIGGANGCTHMWELLGRVAAVAYQSTGAARQRHRPVKPGQIPHQFMRCHMYTPASPATLQRWPHLYTEPKPAADDRAPGA